MWVNIFTFGIDQEFAYDNKGELLRVGYYNHRPANLIDPNVPPTYLVWTTSNFFDTRTGYKMAAWGAHRRANVPWEEAFYDTMFSEDLFNPDLLINEYTSTTEFGATPANWVVSPDPWPHDPRVVTEPR